MGTPPPEVSEFDLDSIIQLDDTPVLENSFLTGLNNAYDPGSSHFEIEPPHPKSKRKLEREVSKLACPFRKAFPFEKGVSRSCKEPGFDNIGRLK